MMSTAKQKIIWMIDSLGPGGAERMTFSIIKNINRENFDIRVCALQVQHGNPVAKELEGIGIPVDLLNIPNLRHPANLPKILTYLNAHQPDLIHNQLEFADIFGNIAGFLLHTPSISTLHTLGNPNKGTAYWRNKIMWLCQKYFCSCTIAVSESTRQHHMLYGKLPAQKVVTIYNGIDLSLFRKQDHGTAEELRSFFGIPKNAPILLTIAVLRELKGVQHMLKAFAKIAEQDLGVYYLIVGDGDYGETLKSIAKSLGIQDRVIFAGQRRDIPELLNLCDIFVLPTLTEALPTVLIEACAAQKAIVASSVGGVPEIVKDGVNGYLVSPSDPQGLEKACLDLLQHKGRREAMGLEGLQIAQDKFDIRQQILSISNLYQGLITNGR